MNTYVMLHCVFCEAKISCSDLQLNQLWIPNLICTSHVVSVSLAWTVIKEKFRRNNLHLNLYYFLTCLK